MSNKRECRLVSNRLLTVGYSFPAISSDQGLHSDADALPIRKSSVLLAIPGWADGSERTCHNIALSPTISVCSIVHGIQCASYAMARDVHGVQAGLLSNSRHLYGIEFGLLLSLTEKGYGIHCSGLVCISANFNGLSLAPINVCLEEKNNNMQIGFISLVSPSRCPKTCPPLGQLSLINYTEVDHIRLGLHFQGGLWNRECYDGDFEAYYSKNLSEQSEQPECPDEGEDRMGHLLQVGLLNEADYVGSHTQLGLVNLNEGYGDSSYTQLGLVNWDDSCIWDDNCIACDSFTMRT